ncbi:hypothetical protein TW81_07225 [Vibrio galatheae]|uniref:Uncharacterized protein n=1 Tax=Vibrio galatheae TaxID=579748 RepID=A0A0F4NL12_9VIBR|nr:hypothetical protein [Vibrio galatheae]KJY83563.1 hypothetical protein TW81_07225 [Vibrio galatheae]
MAVEQFKQSVFDAIKLDNVIWVDDRFAPNSGDFKDEFLAEVKNHYEVAPTLVQEYEPFSTIAELQSNSPFDIWQDQLPEDEDSIEKFYKYIEKDLPDFTPEEFQKLKDIFEDHTNKRVHTLSNKKWQQEKEFWLNNSDENLFLIDYDFSRENLPKDHGKLIVLDVLNSELSNVYCVLFTSETKNGSEEENERFKITKEIPNHINSQYFSVLSKDIMEDDKKICIKFKASEFVKRIFLRKLSSEMVESVSEKLIESINNLKSDLSQQSIYEVDSSIFKSSLDEGASEIDLLHRLFSIKQYEAISQYLNEQNSILEKIVAYRSVQTSPILRDEAYVEYLKGLILPNNNFSKLRHQEVFDETINITHTPIRSGDIFDIGSQKYILLEQACDLMVRGKPDELGERSVNEVLLIPFKTELVSNTKKRKDAHERQLNSRESCDFIVLPKDSNNNIYYTFNFGKAISANINWLDLCVFNSSGLISFDYNQELPPLVFLPGWIKKFNQLKEALRMAKSAQVEPSHYSPVAPCVLTNEPLSEIIVQQYSSFTLSNAQNFDIKVLSNKLLMNGQRVSHLRETFSNKLLRSYFVGYKARIALEKDFSI